MSINGRPRYPPTGYPYGYPPMMGPYPGVGYPSPYGYPSAYPGAQTPEAELQMLESYMEQLKYEREAIDREIAQTETRIEEIRKMIEERGPSPTAPPMPYWGAAPYGVMPPPEQERQMLEQQTNALESQIEAIKKRLDDLSREG